MSPRAGIQLAVWRGHAIRVAARGTSLRPLLLFAGAWLLALPSIGLVLITPLAGFGDRYVYWSSAGDPNYISDGFMKAGFLYSPAAAQALVLLGWLPFEAFWGLFAAAAMLTTAWLVKPLGWRLGPPLWVMALPVSLHGNLEFLFALVAVLGLRHPGLWVIPLLTKISPGVGVVWFLVRKEWRNLAIALGTAGAVVAASFALAPGLWFDWLRMLWDNAQLHGAGWSPLPIPLAVRVAAAALVVGWGASSERRWTIVAGMMLARPDLLPSELTMLLAIPRVQRASVDRIPPPPEED